MSALRAEIRALVADVCGEIRRRQGYPRMWAEALILDLAEGLRGELACTDSREDFIEVLRGLSEGLDDEILAGISEELDEETGGAS